MNILDGIRERALTRFNNGEHLKIKLLSHGNMKLGKSQKVGYLSCGLSLHPHTLSSTKTNCAYSDASCRASCINASGQAALHMVKKTGRFSGYNVAQESRALKNVFFHLDREGFIKKLKHEITLFIARAERKGLIPCLRLNIFSDILWERLGLIEEFPTLQVYDYTRVPNRKNLPSNYHLTFSRGDSNDRHVRQAIEQGMNISVVFEKDLPDTFMGLKVVDGDETDLRFLDSENGEQVCVGLKAKGQGKKDLSRFIVRYDSETQSYRELSSPTTLINRLAA